MGKSKAKSRQKAKSPPSRGELLERAFVLAFWPWDERNTRDGAVKKLRRSRAGLAVEDCLEMLDKGRRLAIEARKLVKANVDEMFANLDPKNGWKDEGKYKPPSHIVRELKALVPGFSAFTYLRAVTRTFWNHHVR